MSFEDATSSGRGLPDGYLAVAISDAQLEAPLKVCVVVRREAEAAGGHFVRLRETGLDGRVLLGCLLDAGGHVHDWLEIWVQDPAGLARSPAVCRQALSNAVLDERWARRFAALCDTDADGIIRTGAETEHPLPAFIDLAAGRVVHLVDAESNLRWQLCRDDAALQAKGLPPYGGSLHGYLWLADLGADSPFVPITPDAPANEACRALEDVAPCKTFAPFNPGGGLMLIRRHGAIGWEAFADLLAGGSWSGVLHGRSPLALEAATDGLSGEGAQIADSGRLFLGTQGRWGRLVETFHLKLRLLADAVEQVRAVTARQDRPMLNLSAESFQIRLGAPGTALPVLWTARAVLADGGDAVALPIAGSDRQYYLPGGAGKLSVYVPEQAAAVAGGRSTVRIRQIITDARNRAVVEGTFATQERLELAASDLVWMRLGLADRRIDLYAHLETAAAMAAGEWRFRSISQALPADQAAALKSAEGVPISDVSFDVVGLLSSPCDLYSLGVLAVRTMLVDEENSLPRALDETFSLARQVAAEHDASAPLAERVLALFGRDPRWAAQVGPGRLTREALAPPEALDLVPVELWCDMLAAIIAMFPGIGPDSACADLGDAPGGLAATFDRAADEMERLLLRTRSLIVIDWRASREVHAAIRRRLVGIGPESERKGK